MTVKYSMRFKGHYLGKSQLQKMIELAASYRQTIVKRKNKC
ncbi:MAG: hypothetical protein ACI8PW_000750 [Methylophilaceae bacterium]|jgi:hypothetical protein